MRKTKTVPSVKTSANLRNMKSQRGLAAGVGIVLLVGSFLNSRVGNLLLVTGT
jgi:hypothetical protein